MKKIFLIIGIICFVFGVSAQENNECKFDDIKTSPLHKFVKEADKLLEIIKNNTKSKCGAELDGAANVIDYHKTLLGRGWDIRVSESDARFYFDPSNVMLLKKMGEHQDILIKLEEKILNKAAEVFGTCAQDDTVENGGSVGNGYDPKGFTLLKTLSDLYLQTKNTFTLFRDLTTNVSERDYTDEKIKIAPEKFTQEMRDYYASKNFQKCLDKDEKRVLIKQQIFDTSESIFNYKLGFDIWRGEYQTLLFNKPPHENVGKFGSKVDRKERKPQADLGGLGNSKVLLSRMLFTETSDLSVLSQTIQEYFIAVSYRLAYQIAGENLFRQSIPDLKKEQESKDEKHPRAIQIFESDNPSKRLRDIDKLLYDDYADRRLLLIMDKAQDPIISVGLVRTIEQLELTLPHLQRLADKICEIYNRQAVNAPGRPTCRELFLLEEREEDEDENEEEEEKQEEKEEPKDEKPEDQKPEEKPAEQPKAEPTSQSPTPAVVPPVAPVKAPTSSATSRPVIRGYPTR